MEKEISTLQKLINTAIEFIVNYSFQALGAVLILILGVLAANWIAGLLLRLFETKKLDITLSKFLANIVRGTVIAFALIIALGKFGITITPFIAAISAMAFGASFALQGPLSNYGAGLSIVLSRPFVVGNTVSVAGVSGVVKEVKLACTVLTNEDGVQITIPNKDIVGKIIHNSRENKVVEAVIGIGYNEDPEKAIRIIEEILRSLKGVSKEPKPHVGIQKFGDFSIDIGFRYWALTNRYFEISHAVNLAVYKAFQKAGVTIPFPQREIRILSQPAQV